jgi:hypothetical protein
MTHAAPVCLSMLLINALRTRNQKQISTPTLCFAELENRVSPTPRFMLNYLITRVFIFREQYVIAALKINTLAIIGISK